MNNRTYQTPYNHPFNTALSQDQRHLTQLFSGVISLKMLQFLQKEMQPYHKYFNVVELALLIDKYIDTHFATKEKEPQKQKDKLLGSVPLPLEPPKMSRNFSQITPSPFQVKKQQTFDLLIQQLKVVFLYYSAQALSYQMLNEYVYNQQLNCLSNGEVDEDYIEIGQKRVRIDQNLKLCIMPLAEEEVQVKTTKIKELIFRQNKKGSELQSIYVLTNEYIRGIRIKPQLIGIASDFHRKGDSNACWYQYENQLIKPKRNTLSVIFKPEENPIINSAQLKEFKASNATNLQQKFSEQLLNILKASLSQNLVGMISLDQSFTVQPISNSKSKVVQGYIGNLVRDIPPQICLNQANKQKYQQILLFHSYSDTEWVIITSKFIYFYRIPLPAQNIILKDQNNLHKANTYKQNPLLLMCQRLPKGCIKAMALNRPYLGIMLQSNSIIIIKLVMNSLGIFERKVLNLQINYFKITNKIYNDIQFKCMCFNPTFNNIFLTDFGAYLIRIAFNKTYGDIEEEGIIRDRVDSNNLNVEMIRNSYSELKMSKNSPTKNRVIHQVDEQQDNLSNSEDYIQVYYLKSNKNQSKNLFSILKKQSKSPHTVIIKNQTRQVITYLTTNQNYNTLITYESQSYEKKTGTEFEGEKYRDWTNRNKIKLWDIRHMTIYKIYDIPIQIAFLQLRANGLFALTADRGFLVFYPFNEDKKAIMSPVQQRLLDKSNQQVSQQLQDVFLQKNCIYFSTLTSTYNKYNNLKIHKTHIYEIQLQKYPQIKLLQAIPSEISALAVNSRVYVLQNCSKGVDASQLHIYNRLGLKEEMIIFSNPEDVNHQGKINLQNYNQEYKFLKRITHRQFEVVIWNGDSLKMIGNSQQESYTIVFSSYKVNHFAEGVERARNIKDIQVVGESMIVYCQNTVRIREKGNGTETASKKSQNTQRKSNAREKVVRMHQHMDNSVILFSNQSDRITYRLQHISPHIKVLHMFNSLILTKEEDGDYDLVKIIDAAENGSLIDKLLFSAKFRRTNIERIRVRQFKEQNFYQMQSQKNVLLQELKEYSLRKMISLEDTKIIVTKNNKLIMLLVFRVQIHYSDLITKKVIRSQLEFMVYARNISDQLFNKNYKISKIQVGKKTEKHLFEYQTTATKGQSIFGHKILSIDDCYAISNYTEIDMHQLCQAIDSEEGRKVSGIDITDKILQPKLIDNKSKDIYQILSLKNDKKLFELFIDYPNQLNAISGFTLKIIEFSEDSLNGTIAISNKYLRSLCVYNFQVDCTRQTPNGKQQQQSMNDKLQKQYQLQMILSKISLMQVKPYKQIVCEEEAKKTDPLLSKQEIHHIRLLQWDSNYKSSVEEIWENTLANIKEFIQTEKIKEMEGKRSISLPPIVQQKLNTLQIKKKEMLTKKLSVLEKYSPEIVNKRLQTDKASVMFKKWTISQAIHLQKSNRDANNISQLKTVNRYVNKVLKSQEDTAERVQQLIRNTRKIKQASQAELRYSRYTNNYRDTEQLVRTQLQQGQMNHQINQVDNIVRSSQIAKQSNIKAYLHNKNNLKTNSYTPQPRQDYKFSRNNTNKSQLTTEFDQPSAPLRSQSKSDIRMTNISHASNQTNRDIRMTQMSKASNHTNISKKGKQSSANIDPNSNSLQNKIRIKLQQIQEKSLSQRRNLQQLKFYTPQRQKGESRFNMSRLKTQKSQTNNESPSEKQKIIRFATQGEQFKKSSIYQNLGNITLDPDILRSPTRNQNNTLNNNKQKVSFLGMKSKPEGKQTKRRSSEDDQKTESAVQKLKRSQQLMKDIYLPQIATTKEKLMKKMKEKRSYVKIIHDHLNDSNLLTIREGEKRKELIKQLDQFK